MDIQLSPSLSFDEAEELETLEAAIKGGLQTFYEVGDALASIRDRKLYRETHKTFEEYCRERWQISDRRARQLMSAAEVVGVIKMSTIVDETKSGTIVPKNEGQARVLAQFDQEIQPAIVRLAHGYANATGKPVTAGMLERIGGVLQEAEYTGHVDTGSGESTALFAAVTAAEFEATERQKQRQQEHYEAHDSRGHVKPEERARREATLSAPDAKLAERVAQELVGYDKQASQQGVTEMKRFALRLAQRPEWRRASDEEKRSLLLEAAGEAHASTIKSSRPKAKPPYRTEREHARALIVKYAPEDELAEFERWWGS